MDQSFPQVPFFLEKNEALLRTWSSTGLSLHDSKHAVKRLFPDKPWCFDMEYMCAFHFLPRFHNTGFYQIEKEFWVFVPFY